MNRHAAQLITRAAINKIGNMLYDYGNSIWLASLGALGQTVLGIYQISELVTSILFNPFGGAIADRFSRRKVLMVTDLICAGLCLVISFISNNQLMIGQKVNQGKSQKETKGIQLKSDAQICILHHDKRQNWS